MFGADTDDFLGYGCKGLPEGLEFVSPEQAVGQRLEEHANEMQGSRLDTPGMSLLVDRLARLPGGALPVEQRVAALVGALWAGYDASSTRASLEILLAMRGVV